MNFDSCTKEFIIATTGNEHNYNDKVFVNLASDCEYVKLLGQGFNVNCQSINGGKIITESTLTFNANNVKDFEIKNGAYDMNININSFSNLVIDTTGTNTTVSVPSDIPGFNVTFKKGENNFTSDFEVQKNGKNAKYGSGKCTMEVYITGNIKIQKQQDSAN